MKTPRQNTQIGAARDEGLVRAERIGQAMLQVARNGFLVSAIFLAAACSTSGPAPAKTNTTVTTADSIARDSAAHQAHANYVRVINSNNIDSLSSMLTDDVIFLSANEKPIVGWRVARDAFGPDHPPATK